VRPLRLLLLGSLPPPAGGTTLLFQQLATRLCARSDVDARVVDTGSRGLAARAIAVIRVALGASRADVISLHASPPGIARAGPLLLRARAPVVIRIFGGSIDLELEQGDAHVRDRLELVLRNAPLVLVETDQVAEWLREHRPAVRVAIQRNSREIPAAAPAPSSGARHFVFVGEVTSAKGAKVLAEAMTLLAGRRITLDVIGRCPEPDARALLEASPGVRIRGEIAQGEIPALVARAEALVLPTLHPAEGHPGAVLEAFASARAVIATNHRAIPELVRPEREGLLVAPGDAPALAAALLRVADDTALAARMGSAAFERSREFDASVWADRFVERCRALAPSRRSE